MITVGVGAVLVIWGLATLIGIARQLHRARARHSGRSLRLNPHFTSGSLNRPIYEGDDDGGGSSSPLLLPAGQGLQPPAVGLSMVVDVGRARSWRIKQAIKIVIAALLTADAARSVWHDHDGKGSNISTNSTDESMRHLKTSADAVTV